MPPQQPGYLELYRSGELQRRAESLLSRLESCALCPRQCLVNRLDNETGFCNTGRLATVASAGAHHGEEPALSGSKGSGTIFFANCNMTCVYCQNYQISQQYKKDQTKGITPQVLARHMLSLQDQAGCHNINLVSPSHVVPQIVEALVEAVQMGLHSPLVYNTSSYDGIETLKALDGIIDIYLADLRYASDKNADKYSQAPDYVARARENIREMYRQVGDLVLDGNGIARRGLIVRHLILPAGIAGSAESLTWLAREISPAVTVSIMAQYHPCYLATAIPELAKTITRQEYYEVMELLDKLEMENGWVQEMSASGNYIPDFERDKPFAQS
jgi:putative pyruvate formate lyase activating enzyme